MKKRLFHAILSVLFISITIGCDVPKEETTQQKNTYVKDNFTKKEVTIEMRDGVKLHTVIYTYIRTHILTHEHTYSDRTHVPTYLQILAYTHILMYGHTH